jgi:hypothetical protein
VAWCGHRGMGHGELGVGGRGTLGPAVGVRWVRVRVRAGANDLESRPIGRAANARRVLQTRGGCDKAGCACSARKNSEWGQATRAYGRARPSGRPCASTSLLDTMDQVLNPYFVLRRD